VESGLSWSELRAVILRVRGSVSDDSELRSTTRQRLREKYARFWPIGDDSDDPTTVTLRLVPVERHLSWDNARLTDNMAP
jgi:hypothetical protein